MVVTVRATRPLTEPLTTLVTGRVSGPLREVRDPGVFVDADGAACLLDCGAGESGIEIARLEGL